MKRNNTAGGFFSLYEKKNCPLIETITELASLPDIDEFHKFKNLVASSDMFVLKQLFVAAARKGILRDVEYMVPFLLGNDLRNAINEGFCVAAQNSHVAIMDLLLKNGANCRFDNDLPLRKAVAAGNVDSVKFLLENGANVHTDDDKLLLRCCQNGDYSDVVDHLIKKGIDVFKHYSTTINSCLNLKRDDCASVLIRYNNELIPNKTGSMGKKNILDDDELDCLIRQKEYDDMNESSDDSLHDSAVECDTDETDSDKNKEANGETDSDENKEASGEEDRDENKEQCEEMKTKVNTKLLIQSEN